MSREVQVGDKMVIPKGAMISQWGSIRVAKRDKKIKVFRLLTLDETSVATVSHGQWQAGTVVAQFFEKSVLNAVRVIDLEGTR